MRNRKEAKKRAEALVEQMTIAEMIGQLRFDAPAIDRLGIPAYNWWNEGVQLYFRRQLEWRQHGTWR